MLYIFDHLFITSTFQFMFPSPFWMLLHAELHLQIVSYQEELWKKKKNFQANVLKGKLTVHLFSFVNIYGHFYLHCPPYFVDSQCIDFFVSLLVFFVGACFT